MQLGKTLIGAIIGAALGIGLLIAIYLLFSIDHVALAIGVALLTGLGVRALVSTSGHASYARGALTGLLALGAYVGGWLLVAEIAKARAAAGPKAPVAVQRQAEEESDEAAPAGEQAAVEEPPPLPVRPTGPALAPKAAAPGQNPMDYIWLAIAALVAYELGRGTGMPATEPMAADGTTGGDPTLSGVAPPRPTPPEAVRPPD
jgi:hypothetical protein